MERGSESGDIRASKSDMNVWAMRLMPSHLPVLEAVWAYLPMSAWCSAAHSPITDCCPCIPGPVLSPHLRPPSASTTPIGLQSLRPTDSYRPSSLMDT
jgi:hypothetical protein